MMQTHLFVYKHIHSMRLRTNLNRSLISDAKHERLKQPDRGCSVSYSKMTAKANKQQQNSTSVFKKLKKGGKARIFLLFNNTRHWFKIAFVSLFSRNIDYIKQPSDMLYIFVL